MSFTQTDKRKWTDDGPPLLQVRQVGAGTHTSFGAYRGARYLGMRKTLKEAMELASKGPLPAAYEPPVQVQAPEASKSKAPASASDDDVIAVLTKRNPFKDKSKVHGEFALLMSYHGHTVREYLAKGGSKTRLRDEINRGLARRVAPSAPKRVESNGASNPGRAKSRRTKK